MICHGKKAKFMNRVVNTWYWWCEARDHGLFMVDGRKAIGKEAKR